MGARSFPYGFAVAMVIVMFVRVPVNPISSDGSGGLLHATFVVFGSGRRHGKQSRSGRTSD